MLKRPYQMALVVILVFAVYYMTIFCEICVIDDYSVMMDFFNAGTITLHQIFLPGSHEGGYYRPLIPLSYLINLRLWDLDVATLHLENILMHVANAGCVYLFACFLLPREGRKDSLVPLAAALCFGFHPITTESVDWISGRTDLIAGFFVLVAALLVSVYRQTGSKPALIGASLSVLVGLLGKETALAFIPGIFFLLMARKEDAAVIINSKLKLTFRDIFFSILLIGGTVIIELYFFNFLVILVTAPLFTCFLLYRARSFTLESGKATTRHLVGLIVASGLSVCSVFAIRHFVFVSSIARISQTIKLMGQDINYTLMIFLGSTGFYIKKFLIPFPLNFAIREIDPLYAVLGTLFFFICIVFAIHRTLPTALSLTGVFLFAPALPLAYGKIAWTAYAERYIYISSAFWTVALVIWISPYLERFGRRHVFIGTTILLLIMASVTIHRNNTWLTNMSLIQDTVAKSPRFQGARILYMGLLTNAGELKKAREQYAIACLLQAFPYDERLDLTMVDLLVKEGRKDEAIWLCNNILEKTHGKSENARNELMMLLNGRIAEEINPDLRKWFVSNKELNMRPSANKKDAVMKSLGT